MKKILPNLYKGKAISKNQKETFINKEEVNVDKKINDIFNSLVMYIKLTYL